MEYDELTAVKVLDAVRDGRLDSTSCRLAGISKKVFYGWLRDKDTRVGKVPLSEVFAEADEDRRMTWRETALELVNALEANSPPNEVTVARAKASMFLQMAKDSSLEVFARSVKQAGDNETPIVIIRKFAPLEIEEGDLT